MLEARIEEPTREPSTSRMSLKLVTRARKVSLLIGTVQSTFYAFSGVEGGRMFPVNLLTMRSSTLMDSRRKKLPAEVWT